MQWAVIRLSLDRTTCRRGDPLLVSSRFDQGMRRERRRGVRSLVRFLLMLLLIMGVWIGIRLGIGFVFHGLMPAIDVGMGTLIGVMTLGLSFQWLSRVSTLSALYEEEETEIPDATCPTMPHIALRASHRKRRRRRS